ncbi:MAG TPA: dTMP kinase [Candidatus Hydrogenedentes bacterium]|nr:dTMP kinase [Candidatus Hydrogenedentota bacterium]
MSGRFITFEGVEGCGKSTQIELLKTHLESKGHRVLVTREPGGVPIAEAIRSVLLDTRHTAMSPIAELLLYEAARAQIVEEIIRPALEKGCIVLCDRFADSTTAYQGAGRGLPMEEIERLHHLATQGVWPDLTFVLDLPVEQGLARARNRGRADRMEQQALEFHQRVRQGYLDIAAREPGRVKVIASDESIEAIATAIREQVDALIKLEL